MHAGAGRDAVHTHCSPDPAQALDVAQADLDALAGDLRGWPQIGFSVTLRRRWTRPRRTWARWRAACRAGHR